MARHTDRYHVELDVEAGDPRRAPQSAPDRTRVASRGGPFCIAVLGDFSGRASRGLVERGRALLDRPVLRVDRDSVDAAIARFAPELRLSVAGSPVTLRFAELDDFHPDQLYERVPQFQALRAAATLMKTSPALPSPASREAVGRPSTRGASRSGGLLDQILGDAPAPPGGAAALAHDPSGEAAHQRGDLDAFVSRVVERHALSEGDPAAAALAQRVDGVIGEEMRALLHTPAFQALESLWRGVSFLVRRVETDEDLRIYLVDISREELAADLAPETPDDQSAIFRDLLDRAVADASGWGLIVGNYTFGPGAEDATTLSRLGRLARAAGAPFVAAAAPQLVGARSFAGMADPEDWQSEPDDAWRALRQDENASWLGLAAPRFLLRVPYGKDSDECERFPFEELDTAAGAPEHEQYLWGNPSIICAELLGEAYADSGWKMRPGRDVGGLPLHIYSTADGPVATPCAEGLLTERALERILEAGVMPLASIRDSDTVRLVRIQSLASPLAPLSGGWQ